MLRVLNVFVHSRLVAYYGTLMQLQCTLYNDTRTTYNLPWFHVLQSCYVVVPIVLDGSLCILVHTLLALPLGVLCSMTILCGPLSLMDQRDPIQAVVSYRKLHNSFP